MVSEASKKKAAQKKAAAAAKRGAKVPTPSSTSSSAKAAADALAAVHLSDRTCTAVLTSHPLSRDIHVRDLSPPRSPTFFPPVITVVDVD
jgi:ATP-binding cassette subfamily F protein 2